MLDLSTRTAEKQHGCLQQRSSMEQREVGLHFKLLKIRDLHGCVIPLFDTLTTGTISASLIDVKA